MLYRHRLHTVIILGLVCALLTVAGSPNTLAQDTGRSRQSDPSPRKILVRSASAARQFRTFHFFEALRVAFVPNRKHPTRMLTLNLSRIHGDYSDVRPGRLRQSGPWRIVERNPSRILQSEWLREIYLGRRYAYREGRGSWHCTNSASVVNGRYRNPFGPTRALPGERLDLLGSSTVRGVKVWRIRLVVPPGRVARLAGFGTSILLYAV